MADILRIKDADGNWIAIPAIKGDPGPQGPQGPAQDLSAYRTAAAQDTIDAGKQSKVTVGGIAKFDENGNATKAVPGTDYQAPISFDDVPTEDSTNGITSGAVYAAIGDIESAINAIRGVSE